MPRRLPRPDTRPSWQFAPVLRDYRMADGTRRTEVDPEYETRYREFLMSQPNNPSWKNDPTYDLAKRRKK